MPQTKQPKIYRIVHLDRLPSIMKDGFLWSDAAMAAKTGRGTMIGMTAIKARRLTLELDSHAGLHVGECVPFYFCPRSIMLFLLHSGNHPDLSYRGGQQPILHLESDLLATVAWAEKVGKRWAFTLSNAGAYYFEDRSSLKKLDEINWDAVVARKWSGPGVPSSVKEGKQAEFLVETQFPWHLVEQIGTCTPAVAKQVAQALRNASHKPTVSVQQNWYY